MWNPEIFIIVVVLGFIYLVPSKCYSVTFEREWIGVSFSPYVKTAESNNTIPGSMSYTFENLQTMVEVVSSKFSYLLTEDVGAIDDTYRRTGTYYSDSLVIARTAEAAALLNKDSNNTNLRVIIGINVNGKAKPLTQVYLAKEAFAIAERIQSKTVEGVVFTTADDEIVMNLKSILVYMRAFHKSFAGVSHPRTTFRIKIGAAITCNKFLLSQSDDKYSAEIYRAKLEIVLLSKFLICKQKIRGSIKSIDSQLNSTSAELLQYRELLKQINENVEVMGWTAYYGQENKGFTKYLQNMQQYWIGMNAFAKQNQFRMWMYEAFHNNNREDTRLLQMGWWRLKRNNLINSVSGYVEKVYDHIETTTNENKYGSGLQHALAKSEFTSSETNIHVLISILGGITALVIVLILSCVMQNRFKVFSIYITRKEIQRRWEYESCTARSFSTTNRRIYVTEDFSHSHETTRAMLKDQLEKQEEIISNGEFISSYKAILMDNCGSRSAVFVKSTKAGCSSHVLKSILAESKILAYLGKHKNIVSICGLDTSTVENRVVRLATEFCSLGSLKTCIIAFAEENLTNPSEIPYDDMIRWSHDIACGMEYLEEKDVVHNNLASKNIYVNSDKVAKISYFKYAKRLYGYAALNGYSLQESDPLIWKWRAPEALSRSEFSIQSDVWSFGITLWEIFTLGKEPYDGYSGNHKFIQSLEEGLRPAPAQYACEHIKQMLTECWILDPTERTGFSELKFLIQFLLRKLDTIDT